MKKITDEMNLDKEKIIKKSQEVFKLNTAIEQIVSERTRTELALKIAHEIRNPVTIIGGLAKRILKEPALQNCINGTRDKLEKIVEQLTHLEKLVLRFEGIRKKDTALLFDISDLNGIVEEVVEVIGLEATAKGIFIYLNIAPLNLNFLCNKQLIKVIILHIVRNALDFCAKGNIIDIETDKIPSGILVRISDNGPGISEEILEHIFEPYARTEFGATGLELPFIKQIVDEHRGDIKIKSKLRKGTVLEIIFPTHLEELKNIGINNNTHAN
jgi:signal transduction histidine kinase